MRRRKDGKKNVNRVTASVSVNDVDHPLLYKAIIEGGVDISHFPSISGFLAGAGEKELQRIGKEETSLSDLKNLIMVINESLEEIKRLGVRLDDNDDDGFDGLRDVFQVT